MSELWDSAEAIAAARERFESAIPGWRPPAAYGIGRINEGRVEFARINTKDHRLPGVILATVCGHTGGSRSYVLEPDGLARAIAMLAPAEAYTGQDHPNIAAWRHLRTQLTHGERVVVVFDADPTQTCSDRHVLAMRDALRESSDAG